MALQRGTRVTLRKTGVYPRADQMFGGAQGCVVGVGDNMTIIALDERGEIAWPEDFVEAMEVVSAKSEGKIS